MAEEEITQPTRIKSHCNSCSGAVWHVVLHRQREHDSELVDDGYTIEWAEIYQMLRCCGCDSISFRHTLWFSEEPDDETVPYYPPLISRKKPEWIDDLLSTLPSTVAQLLNEIYVALHSGSHRLAAMGVRSLIELIMIEKVGDGGAFTRNLSEFHTQGWISQKQKDTLTKIIDAGHAATHRNFNPGADDLKTLMDITEGLIAEVYVHPQSGATLGSKIPARRSKP